MTFILQPWHLLLTVLAGLVNRQQQEVIEYLTVTNQGGNIRPAVIVLDLNMPQINGFEVLTWLLTQPELNGVHRGVLSASNDERDRDRAQMLGSLFYVVKPFSFDDLITFVREMQEHWLGASPKSPEPPTSGPRPWWSA